MKRKLGLQKDAVMAQAQSDLQRMAEQVARLTAEVDELRLHAAGKARMERDYKLLAAAGQELAVAAQVVGVVFMDETLKGWQREALTRLAAVAGGPRR